ncbi:MAG: hypothetical protein K9H49_05160 [Bacteroidales bacterium]|nr:hypothetical protein [Bacteroidales bacterium]MCF8389882.1 hypothetical protein [Bacteroidales bacterium]
MRKALILCFLFLYAALLSLIAQDDPLWDNPAGNSWAANFKTNILISSKDSSLQNMIFFEAEGDKPQPLIISLHTWSANYTQNDPIAERVANLNWNYIHPDFRGAANTPQSCGSKFVISDIEDAIDFALKNFPVDKDEIHIIGVSGGAYTALVSYLKVNRPVKSFSVWVPISDLESWYWESWGRENKYAYDLIKISGSADSPDFSDLRARSPMYMDVCPILHKDSRLSIYTGIHDGYEGSVPITHSINFYNRLILKRGANRKKIVGEKEIISLLTKRCNPEFDKEINIGDRKVHLLKTYKNITLTVFEGVHEMLPDVAIQSIINEK